MDKLAFHVSVREQTLSWEGWPTEQLDDGLVTVPTQSPWSARPGNTHRALRPASREGEAANF